MQATLIRHSQIPANVDRRYVGRTDQDLTEAGRELAAATEVPEADKVYVSPYKRCVQTASIMYPNQELIVVDGLKEMDFGIFENRTADEMFDFKPYRDWVDSMCLDPIPEGESMAEFDARVDQAFRQIVSECSDGDNVSLVVHGGTIMSIMGLYNDEGLQYFDYNLHNCEYFICDVQREPEISLHRIGGVEPHGNLPPKDESEQADEEI